MVTLVSLAFALQWTTDPMHMLQRGAEMKRLFTLRSCMFSSSTCSSRCWQTVKCLAKSTICLLRICTAAYALCSSYSSFFDAALEVFMALKVFSDAMNYETASNFFACCSSTNMVVLVELWFD